MRTKLKCKMHGWTLHGAQNRCLLCKKDQSSAFRSSRRGAKLPSRQTARSVGGSKICERPGCKKKATMWTKDPRWCGHTHRIWCYRQAMRRAVKRSKVTA